MVHLQIATLAFAASTAVAAPQYELMPKIACVQRPVVLTIRALTPESGWREEEEYPIRIAPMEWKAGANVTGIVTLRARPRAGQLQVNYTFPDEQEYAVELLSPDSKETLARFRAYAVAPDLFARRPYKGDLHQHSNRSDGKEEPAYVAAFNRKIGMDFMALTDHRKYAPSLEAIEAFAGLPIDLRLYPGEEVHPPETFVHIVNFGGRASVNERFQEPEYARQVEEIAQGLKDLPDGLNPRAYAACLWAFAEIRRQGGIGIFCHPYWVTGSRYNVPEALIDRFFADKPFDAYELIGGFWLTQTESNALQIARYYQEAAQGRRVPVVGVSDGHGTARGLHGWYHTLVLAHSPELADLREAILSQHSLAVEHLPDSPAPRAYGPFRLVKYAGFLQREVLPAHDALCAEEGEAMLAHVAGDAAAPAKLKALQGRVQKLYERLWAP